MNATDPFAGERPKLSPFHPRQSALNIRDAWSSWNGYRFAEYYYDIEYEYFCVRNRCATYDISPMQKYGIEGGDAEAMLNRMVTRDVTRIGPDRVGYVLWCTDAGRLIDDGTIFRLAADRFMLTCGSPCTAWLARSAFGFADLQVRDLSDELAALSVQGPTSCAVLKRLGLEGIEAARPFDIRHFDFHGEPLMVSRTGFTGDLGYELWIEPGFALQLWDELYAAGEPYGIQPYGEAATNMARLEAGFIMPAMEFNEALRTVHFEGRLIVLEVDGSQRSAENRPLRARSDALRTGTGLAGGFPQAPLQRAGGLAGRQGPRAELPADPAGDRGQQARGRVLHLRFEALHERSRLRHLGHVVAGGEGEHRTGHDRAEVPAQRTLGGNLL